MVDLDLSKQFASLYKTTAKAPVVVDVPALSFLMIDGAGDPNTSQAFKDAVGALFSVSYTLKFSVKKETGLNYRVMPLEGLWRTASNAPYDASMKADLVFTLMVLQPDIITGDMVQEAVAAAAKKKPNPALASLRLETFQEGQCVQILHKGPFDEEPATMERVHAFMHEQRLRQRADHHEIYLSDLTKTAPDRLKTILRTPVEPAT